jgi:hypothetical protein
MDSAKIKYNLGFYFKNSINDIISQLNDIITVEREDY